MFQYLVVDLFADSYKDLRREYRFYVLPVSVYYYRTVNDGFLDIHNSSIMIIIMTMYPPLVYLWHTSIEQSKKSSRSCVVFELTFFTQLTVQYRNYGRLRFLPTSDLKNEEFKQWDMDILSKVLTAFLEASQNWGNLLRSLYREVFGNDKQQHLLNVYARLRITSKGI